MSFSSLSLTDQLSSFLFSYRRIKNNETKVKNPTKKIQKYSGCQDPTKKRGYSVFLSAKELLCYDL